MRLFSLVTAPLYIIREAVFPCKCVCVCVCVCMCVCVSYEYAVRLFSGLRYYAVFAYCKVSIYLII